MSEVNFCFEPCDSISGYVAKRLGYAERFEWSRVIAIPEDGLLIQPDPNDVRRYLQRHRQLS